MILSVSRRTDIPAFYSNWFYNRIKAGFVDVRNPMNIHQVGRIKITPDVVDCIVFWTKNPQPMLSRLDKLSDYKYYFQITINPYDNLIETDVPRKASIIDSFKYLSEKIGSDRVIWRYDPILLSNNITVSYHIKYFEELAKRLHKHTAHCVISFINLYKKTITNTKDYHIFSPSENEMMELANNLSIIAQKYNIKITSCSEKIDLTAQGIENGCCIDPYLIEKICGYKINIRKDKNQREECKCVESIDIGAYNTCCHNCVYCYANSNKEKVKLQSSKHIETSSLLIGELTSSDIIKEREVKLLKSYSLF